jgi:signal transduction histidine kinase
MIPCASTIGSPSFHFLGEIVFSCDMAIACDRLESVLKRIEQEREQILHREQTAREAAERANHERKAQLQQASEFEAMLGRVIDKVRDSLDETQILQTVVKELALVLNASCCNTAVYNLEQGTSTICYEYAVKDHGAQKRTIQIAADSGVYQQLLQKQYSQFCSLTPNPLRGRVAMLACPIFDDCGVLGDLWLINQSDYVFKELEIRLVQQVANQCAIAIRQARLYQAATAQIKELERLNQLKDDFLSTVSHELRTPIANMKMAIAMLKVASNSEKQERYLNILQAECKRESEMINDLLDLQRLEGEFCTDSSLLEAITLQETLPKIVEPFYVRAGQRQQNLQLNLPLNLPVLICNYASLERIIVELINNACKYTDVGGDIVLGIRYESTQIATIFTISNSAEIPQDQLPRIFDKFYRVPQGDRWQQGGTGLGLALVQKLVERMQGNIGVECSQGWTSSTVKLPNQIKTS